MNTQTSCPRLVSSKSETHIAIFSFFSSIFFLIHTTRRESFTLVMIWPLINMQIFELARKLDLSVICRQSGRNIAPTLKLPKLTITLLKWFIKLDEQNCRFFDKKKNQYICQSEEKDRKQKHIRDNSTLQILISD